MAFTLPTLPYSYEALEPIIDQKTMQTHHSKHHNAYVENLNKTLEKYPQYLEMEIKELMRQVKNLPQEIRQAVINNGGAHFNHSMYFEQMVPGGAKRPQGVLAQRIEQDFGSFEQFQEKFKEAGVKRFGSGWAWLVAAKDGSLSIESSPNQDNPVMEGKEVILTVDVWEHAYYLKYLNKRPDHIDAWWQVINWDIVLQRYQKIISHA